MSTVEPRFEVAGLAGGYDGERQLDGIDLLVDRGEIVAVVGANGCGKTTLLSALAGTVRARSGQVRLDGVRIEGWPPEHRARAGVRLLAQTRRIFPSLTVEENFALVGRTLRGGDADRFRLAVSEWSERFDVIGTRMSAPAGDLSGGEQQLVAIGRILAARPKVMLLDEPSAGLAPEARASCAAAFRSAAADGAAVVVVEQDLEFAQLLADRAVTLAIGRLSPRTLER